MPPYTPRFVTYSQKYYLYLLPFCYGYFIYVALIEDFYRVTESEKVE